MKMDQDSPMSRKSKYPVTRTMSPRTSGVVLLVTLVVLLVLATLGYNLASRVAAQRHRNNYIIDYTNACYARDSAVKYALAILQDMNDIELVSRPNEPDFSDLFALKEPDYRRMLEEWAAKLAKEQPEPFGDPNEEADFGTEDFEGLEGDVNIRKMLDFNEGNESNGVAGGTNVSDFIKIRGPYGPPWPFVAEPVEFEVGSAKVKIEIEDENAKFPIGWGMLDGENVQREAQASLDTFCEWMGLNSDQVNALKEQLKQVATIRSFKVELKPLEQKTPKTVEMANPRRRGVRRRSTVYQLSIVSPAEQFAKQARDFSKLFHNSIVDTDMLATPTIISEDRKESALKYMSLCGTTQVNINSAPRQVLEAAFTFGGDAQQVAEEIIKKRREKPFAGIEELRKELYGLSGSIEKAKLYITASSNMFTIRVTAVSGAAKASAVIVVLKKEGGKIERIALASG